MEILEDFEVFWIPEHQGLNREGKRILGILEGS
jgi:hypothetical protein